MNKAIFLCIVCLICGIALLKANDVSSKANDVSLNLPEPTQPLLEKLHKFKTFTGKGLEDFIGTLPELLDVESVFYPFGGADALYPLLVFPNVRHITLVGLERTGKASAISPDNMYASCSRNIDSLLRRSFFVTMDMQTSLSREQGVAPCILTQLSLLGAKDVKISTSDTPAPHLKIAFNYKNKERILMYYRVNLQDQSIPMQLLASLKEDKLTQAVLLKATSYTPHQKGFAKIKKFIKDSASIIVQDDSGIPIRYLKDTHTLRTFGQYHKPIIKVFKGYAQKDLQEKTSENKEKLSFCFGYGCSRISSTLILATKKTQVD